MDWTTVDTNRRTDVPDFIDISFSKTYKDEAAIGGVVNDNKSYGLYKFYAVDIITLQDIAGLTSGTVLQRPSVTLINGVAIGAFGGYCELFNYTGILVEVSTTSGIGVTSIFAMESSPGDPLVVTDFNTQEGGKARIWEEHANGDMPTSGRTPLSTLHEVVLNFAVSPAGKINLSDYFDPFEYVPMGAGGRDLGSGGVALLVSTVFVSTGVSRIAVVIGRMGKYSTKENREAFQ
ncbi:hypothetical protein BPAE_0385g00030 [Botrytis paeoniae]|uniref:Uncharacterized protein n=1 Tax=Botrytis paeoniae TaxID=278948 RepID=A0A4Z1FA65_9HELO|nr:hypothetical protein BPAE_0385g00030 [Botrytis paeoniae]